MANPTEIAALEIRITGVEKAISQFSNFQQTTTKTMSASEAAVTRSLKNMVAQFVGVAAVARSVQNVVSSGVGFDQFVENTTMSFTVMMKSADKAKAQMKSLYDFAVNSPLTFKETASSSKQLMAYGFAAQDLIPTMQTLGSVAIATGHSLDDISYVYGTLKSQGRAYSRDLMQFGMRGIPIYDELAKVMGVNVNQIQKMASEGKIGFAEVEQAFKNMTTGSGIYAGIIDGYMTTLTGKLSMLSDIGQQSMGTLMSEVTDQLKLFVDSMTKAISGKDFQTFIKEASGDLGVLSGVLAKVLETIVTLLPVVQTIIKVIALPAAVIGVLVLVGKLPGILMAVGAALSALSANLIALNSQLIATTAAESAMAMGAATATTGITALSASLKALAIANPWLLALIGIAAVGGAIITIVTRAANSARESTDATIRAGQLTKDYSLRPTSGMGSAMIDPSAVASIAKDYQLADSTVASILEKTGNLNKLQYDTYILNAKNIADSKSYSQGQLQTGTKVLTQEETQQKYLSELNDLYKTGLVYSQTQQKYVAQTSLDMSAYQKDMGDKTAGAKGTTAAQDYIQGFADKMEADKKLYGAAFTPEMNKADLEAEAKDLYKTLADAQNVTGLFEQTGFDETIIARLVQINKLLDTTKGKAVTAAKELGKWWAPIVQAAKNSIDPIDDITVSTQQASEAATKEFNDRQKNYDELIKQAKTEQDAIRYMQLKSSEAALYLQYQKDITAEGEKQKNLKLYETATEGNSAVMDQWKANAGAAYAKGGVSGNIEGAAIQSATQTVSGTQVGAMLTGGNPLAGAASALVDFAKSITNVNALLNPFTTIFEAMRTTLEPIVNNVLQPLVDILQMVGEAIAPVISVLVASLKPAIVQIYLVTAPLIAAMQLLAAAHIWFYNSVLVPVANWIINIANAIIKVLNRIPGVHIRYIDQLEKMGAAVVDLTGTINDQKSALDQTIDYLTDKINNAIDDQLASLQDLYEVGAVSTTSYDEQVSALNAQKISTDDILVSAADMALTGKDIYERLYTLYDLKDTIENSESLTDAQLSALMTEYGLTSSSRESLMKSAIIAALSAYGAATSTDSGIGSSATSQRAIAAAQANIASLTAALQTATVDYNSKLKFKDSAFDSVYDAAASNYTSVLNAYNAAVEYFKKLLSDLGVDASTYGFATGTSNVPNDMLANIHKGEGIVPATFMDSIRSGELALSSGKNEGSGQNVIVHVTVQGSVQTENDLATSIAQAIYVQRSRGALTV